MIVRFWISERSSFGCGEDDCCVSEGVCVPVPALETGREGKVWLSRVRRSEVMMTWGT